MDKMYKQFIEDLGFDPYNSPQWLHSLAQTMIDLGWQRLDK